MALSNAGQHVGLAESWNEGAARPMLGSERLFVMVHARLRRGSGFRVHHNRVFGPGHGPCRPLRSGCGFAAGARLLRALGGRGVAAGASPPARRVAASCRRWVAAEPRPGRRPPAAAAVAPRTDFPVSRRLPRPPVSRLRRFAAGPSRFARRGPVRRPESRRLTLCVPRDDNRAWAGGR